LILHPIGQVVNILAVIASEFLEIHADMRMTDLNALPIQKELIKAKEEDRNSRSYLLHVFNSFCAFVCIDIFHFSEKDQRIKDCE